MRTVVVVPTFQEAENIERFLRETRQARPDADILVVDDGSPDGTAEIAAKIGAEVGGVSVLERRTKDGLGNAYRAGFARVLGEGYDRVVQMDSDLSHDPKVIDDLLARLDDGADCAIGSRYVPGGGTPNWPLHRRVLSAWGNRYTAALLDLGVSDATSGFRAYEAAALERIDIGGTRSTGYAFMSEVVSRLVRSGARIDEVPITFVDRTHGTSKMSGRIIVESMARVTISGLGLRRQRRKSIR